jgi:DNA-binding transcriptional ArsR family regulator
MIEGPCIAEAASLIGDRSRAVMLSALMDGRALTATELAYASGITAQTASGHLAKLADANLIAVEKQGRYRYYRLANVHVAHALEALINLAVHGAPHHRPSGPRDDTMRYARTCYDHLAGRVGIALTQSLVKEGMLEEGEEAFEITAKGRQWLSAFGIDLEEVERSRRARASRCLDWSERTPHLGGALGAAILDQLQSRKWVTRKKGSRAVTLTPLGRREPKRALGIALSPS